MWSKHCEAGDLLKDERENLINIDGDTSPRQLTDFPSRDLKEIPDAWGNPIAYIEKSDYAAKNRRYLTKVAATGEDRESVAVAFKNKSTGDYFDPNSYQFISAGPDGEFGTDDDVTSFHRDQDQEQN